jgi:type II secretory pathway pseudopilin PulG
MQIRTYPRREPSRRERGYILITLLLFVALLVIAAGVMAPIIAFQVKRDREEELVHRGVQYSRAMKYYVKKFGRYPTRIEELENTNQVRFLRRRYKDPVTGKDFKILHMGDVQMAFGGGIAGAVPANGLNPSASGGGPGALNSAGLAPGGGTGANGLNPGGLGSGGLNPGLSPGGAVAGPKGVPIQNSGQGSDADNSDESSATGSNPAPGQTGGPAAGPGAPGTFGAVGSPGTAGQGQVFGGGPMVGVASTSRDKSIRVFNKKEHYNEWQFIYDPSSDRGGLLTTPNQPGLAGTGTSNAVQTPGAPGSPGTPGGFGSGPGQPGSGTPPQGPPGMQTPQLPPDQTEQ